MNEFAERISKLSPQRLTLLALELQAKGQRSDPFCSCQRAKLLQVGCLGRGKGQDSIGASSHEASDPGSGSGNRWLSWLNSKRGTLHLLRPVPMREYRLHWRPFDPVASAFATVFLSPFAPGWWETRPK